MTPGDDVKLIPKPTRYKSYARRRRQQQSAAHFAIWSISVIVFGLTLTTLIQPSSAQDGISDGSSDASPAGASSDSPAGAGDASPADSPDPAAATAKPAGNTTGSAWRKGYDGDGTTHEQIGQEHFAPPEYTEYTSEVVYNKEPEYPKYGLGWVFATTRFLFETVLVDDPPLPPGYVAVKGEDTLTLGRKVEENDWRDLLDKYFIILVWVMFLLFLIILIPFIAVCYCCFCCCRRCNQGCPPCTSGRDARMRCCCGLLLLLLLLLILLGVIIAFLTNKMVDRGFEESSATLRRGADDTCRFLKDVSDHIYHLFIYNYQELQTHLIKELNNAYKHIFLDLADTSESNAIEELLRILQNMPEALKLMMEVDKIEKDIRFLGSQLRDGVRGVKRDINFAAVTLCDLYMCRNFLGREDVEYLDTSPCIHYDEMPNTTVFVEGIQKIIEKNYVEIPKKALERLNEISEKVKTAMKTVIPPLVRDVIGGADMFRMQATNIRTIIDAVLSDIQLNTMRSSKSFEDVYDKFGPDRNYINLVVCFILLFIIIVLFIALLYGCCGVAPTGYGDRCCNRGTGAMCLLLAIILIFMFFSIITLIALFYYVLGLVTYEGACSTTRDQEGNTIFRQLDALIELKQYVPIEDDHNTLTSGEYGPSPPIKMSNAIKACEANQTIFELLRLNNLYDINDLTRIKVIQEQDPDSSPPVFTEDLSKVIILTKEEKIKLSEMRNGNLSSYHSILYTVMLCKPFTPVDLDTLAKRLRSLAGDITTYPNYYGWAWVSFQNEAYQLQTYEAHFVPQLGKAHKAISEKLKKIDSLILYENHNFSQSIAILVDSIVRSETFIQTRGKDYINTLGVNLTQYLQRSIGEYIEYVIKESNENVGHCGPLAYIYYRGFKLICEHLVDPINGFWFALLLCTLLFLPVLFIAHKLMCLYKKIGLYAAAAGVILEGGCPVCTGQPYMEPPIVTCTGGQQASCGCADAGKSRGSGGGLNPIVTDLVNEAVPPEEIPSTSSNQVSSSMNNKRKQD